MEAHRPSRCLWQPSHRSNNHLGCSSSFIRSSRDDLVSPVLHVGLQSVNGRWQVQVAKLQEKVKVTFTLQLCNLQLATFSTIQSMRGSTKARIMSEMSVPTTVSVLSSKKLPARYISCEVSARHQWSCGLQIETTGISVTPRPDSPVTSQPC